MWLSCDKCGDALHSFFDELESGSIIYVVMCPTCYTVVRKYPVGRSVDLSKTPLRAKQTAFIRASDLHGVIV